MLLSGYSRYRKDLGPKIHDKERGVEMKQSRISFGLSVLVIVGVFSLGYLCGSLPQRQADAQMESLRGMMGQAGKAGGSLGAVSELGTSIVEMQEHVSGLQKNLDTLKKVQAALTGK